MPAPRTLAHLPADDPSAPAADAQTDAPVDAPATAANRRGGRLLAGGLAAAVAITAGISLGDLRAADATATADAQHAAAIDLVGELTATRLAYDTHLRGADGAAATVLRHHAAALGGAGHDPERVAAALDEVRTHADALAELAAAAPVERPSAVPVATADPLFDRLNDVRERAAEIADDLHVAADDAAALDGLLIDVRTVAADHLGDSALTGSDTPDAVADAWRSERDLLDDYRQALEALDTDAATVDLTPLVDVQLTFADALQDVADQAVTALDEGDLDAYDQVLDEQLRDDDILGVDQALRDARTKAGDQLVTGPLAEVRTRLTALRLSLGDLRDATPSLLAR